MCLSFSSNLYCFSIAVPNNNYCIEVNLGLFSLYTATGVVFAILKMGVSHLQGLRLVCLALVWSLHKEKLAKEWFLQQVNK